MYKYVKNIILTLLFITSFFLTKQLVMVAKEYDEVMIEIKNNLNNYKKEPIEAIIKDNTIIPGINGYEIDVPKSYKKMKEYGKYSSNLLIYKKVVVKNKLKDNYGKFIIKGNPNKKQISIIMNCDNVEDKYKDKINLAIDKPIENNENYIIGTFKDNLKEIKSMSNQKDYYCYNLDYNIQKLKKCSEEKFYTIVPNIVVKNNLQELKKITPGSIIYIEKTNNLRLIINYIQNKGYDIVLLNKLLEE